MNVYLFNYDDLCGDERDVLAFIDKQEAITNWAAYLPSSVFLVSRLGLERLTELFSRRFKRGLFVLVEVQEANGMLPLEAWDVLNGRKRLPE